MKKLFVLLLALLMIGTAVAEGSLPIQNYLIGRGYTVMDEAQLNSMSGESSEDGSEMAELGNLIILSSAENTPAIIYTMDGTMYFAFDMMSMFSDSTDAGGITSVFLDACRQYEFDAYMASTAAGQYCYTASEDLLARIEAQAEDQSFTLIDSMDGFISVVEAQ